MGRSRKNAKAPSRAKRLRNASDETAAKQQYRAIHLDVRERENVARRELYLDPVVHNTKMLLAKIFIWILLFTNVKMLLAKIVMKLSDLILLSGNVRMLLAESFIWILLFTSVRMLLAEIFIWILLFTDVRMLLAERFMKLSDLILLSGSVRMPAIGAVKKKKTMRLEEVELLI
jgi:hypothetical protein